MRTRRAALTAATALLAVCLLGACAERLIRASAQEQLKAGDYEKAIKTYDNGLERYPGSVELRAGRAGAREAVFQRLMRDASAARAGGNSDAAEHGLRRALAINPNDERARALLLDVARDRRQKDAHAEARELIAKGLLERAQLVIEAALRDNPRNGDLAELQRRLESAAQREEMATLRLADLRPVSLDFRDANLRTVLEVLTRNSGVNFVLDKDVRQDLRTTVFLRQTSLEDCLGLITSTSQLSFKVIDPTTVLVYPRTPEKAKEYQNLVIRAFYLTNADVKQTSALLKSVLKIRDPFIDEKINMIVVRETPETVRLAERLVALHDLPEPEVMMEVEVLEVKNASLTELGIKYPDSLTLTPIPPAGTGFTLGNIGRLNRDAIGLAFPGATINLHRDVGGLRVLANPKIRARNREKARILIGDKLPIITTTSSTNGFVADSVQYVDVGIKLDVEPNIYLDDDVAIKVGLEVSSLVREIRTPSGSLVYQIGTRTAATVLRLRDGETQLLAGLISNDERSSANRIPGIGDLPVIGRLFSSQRDEGQRTEIVLSITPHIIRNTRRPDLNQIEFWSGTENNATSRALTSAPPSKSAAPAIPGPGALAPVPVALAAASAGLPPGRALLADSAIPVLLSMSAPSNVKQGETFAAIIGISTGALVRGMPLQISFNPVVLELIEAEEGAFFTQGGAAVSLLKNLDAKSGSATLGILRNVAEGVKGEGAALTLTFKAIGRGAAEISVMSATPVSAQTVAVPTLPQATLTVN